MSSPLPVTDDPIALMGVLRFLLAEHLGTFSNGAPAIWLKGADIPSALSVDGCLLVLNEDYLVRSRSEFAAHQFEVIGVWQMDITQYGHTPESQAAKRAIKRILLHSFPDILWRPATPLKGQYPRAICYLQFSYISNSCQYSYQAI
jgi:hypothetical protein